MGIKNKKIIVKISLKLIKNPPKSNVIIKYALRITWDISIKEEIQKKTPENSVIVPATNSDSASENSKMLIRFCKYIHKIISSTKKIEVIK